MCVAARLCQPLQPPPPPLPTHARRAPGGYSRLHWLPGLLTLAPPVLQVLRVLHGTVMAPGGGRGRNQEGDEYQKEVERLLREYEQDGIRPAAGDWGSKSSRTARCPRWPSPPSRITLLLTRAAVTPPSRLCGERQLAWAARRDATRMPPQSHATWYWHSSAGLLQLVMSSLHDHGSWQT